MDGWLHLAENQNRTVVERGEERSLNSEENDKTMGKWTKENEQKRIRNDGWIRKQKEESMPIVPDLWK